MTKESYLADPCGTSSLPYWKAAAIRIPAGVRVLHARELEADGRETDGALRYFRLLHPMRSLRQPAVPTGFETAGLSPEEAADHIRKCYRDISASASELQACAEQPAYAPELWISLRERAGGEIAASGIGALDRDLREGTLEWIQVSPEYRKRGLGTFLVRELLWRMRGRADFATVSGRVDDPCRPEGLYRGCGFAGSDVWYVLREERDRSLPR